MRLAAITLFQCPPCRAMDYLGQLNCHDCSAIAETIWGTITITPLRAPPASCFRTCPVRPLRRPARLTSTQGKPAARRSVSCSGKEWKGWVGTGLLSRGSDGSEEQ